MAVKTPVWLPLSALLLVLPASASMDWSSLWRNADQRGEQLLRSGDAATAAKTFTDPRRKAFAELKAGDNEAAVRDLGALDDTDSHYNRGNALARTGRLDEALKAYDSALQRDPANQDARHNRDLVARALEQQKQQQDQSGSSGQSGQSDKSDKGNDGNGRQDPAQKQGQNQDQKQRQTQGQEPNQSPGSTSGDDQGKDKDRKDRKGNAGSTPNSDSGSRKPGEDSQSQAANNSSESHPQDARQSASAPAQQAGKEAPAPAKSTEQQQAEQDAAAGLKPADKDAPRGATASAQASQQSGKPGGDPMMTAPVSEQKLAEDQWLRRIPDDPGGLLRRKFMIEHLLRQQQQSDSNSAP